MDQLTMNDILAFCAELRKQGMTMEEIKALPVYLGDDNELNGIHTAGYTNLVDSNDTENEDNVYSVELINEDSQNIKLDGKAVLIS